MFYDIHRQYYAKRSNAAYHVDVLSPKKLQKLVYLTVERYDKHTI